MPHFLGIFEEQKVRLDYVSTVEDNGVLGKGSVLDSDKLSFGFIRVNKKGRFTSIIEGNAASAFKKDCHFKVPKLVVAAIELGFKVEFVV